MATQNSQVYDRQINRNIELHKDQDALPLQSTLRTFKVRHTLTSALANTEAIRLGFPRLRKAKLMQALSRYTVIGATGFNGSMTINKVPGGTGSPVALTAAAANNNTNAAFAPVSAGHDTPLVDEADALIAVVSPVTTAAIGAVLEFELVFDCADTP